MAEADGGRHRPKDLEGGRGVEDAREKCMLTLGAWVVAAVAEEAWNGGNRPGGRRSEAGKRRTKMTSPSFPARFRGRGRRGDHGGAPGALRSAPGGFNRRRCGGEVELGHGHGGSRVRVWGTGEKRGGERAGGFGVLLIHPGGAKREGAAEEATATRRPWRQWFSCGASREEEMTGRSHPSGF